MLPSYRLYLYYSVETFLSILFTSLTIAIETLLVENGYASIKITGNCIPKTLYVAIDNFLSHRSTVVTPTNARAMLIESPLLTPANLIAPRS
jgi:hypothetical protein